jgi:DNA-directed RNA polymerase specialized sigma24 family protein
MKKLGVKSRQLVHRRYVLGEALDQIAAAVSWTAKAVNTALYRARKTLRQCVSLKIEGTGNGVG